MSVAQLFEFRGGRTVPIPQAPRARPPCNYGFPSSFLPLLATSLPPAGSALRPCQLSRGGQFGPRSSPISGSPYRPKNAKASLIFSGRCSGAQTRRRPRNGKQNISSLLPPRRSATSALANELLSPGNSVSITRRLLEPVEPRRRP